MPILYEAAFIWEGSYHRRMESRKDRHGPGRGKPAAPKPPKAKKKRRAWLWSLFAVVLVMAGLVAFFIVDNYNALNNLQKDPENSIFEQFENDAQLEKPPEWEGTERVNILIMGGDGRAKKTSKEPARSDSMIVVSIDPVTKKAHLFSLLRDTWVDIPGHGQGRANEAIVYGGYKLSMQMISELTGLEIQYYVYTEFEGFKSLVDAIGGINIDVEKNMRYTDNADGNRYDIDLKKGYQELNGDQALQYVRFRHDATSDFTRTERQRKFLSAVADKMKNFGNITQLSTIIRKVSPFVETNLSANEMARLAKLGLGLHNAGTAQLPPSKLLADERVGGASVLAITSEDKLREYVQEVLAEDQNAPEPSASPGENASSNAASP
ncbi:Cell envelope-associated transcriptional attenuator LytR-CpsA-Psr, subfamily M [Paenibacillus pasadenensis]|uniref:Cell envelope-associated transcriptional attenuator LytR-CpsA-Psr, subfamily M n=2 Tax=Paenibacillus pasadenensis TaxID=217090 RepID=A0A2N5NBI3_9BACL|nr:Cell envelope-associated transcriptional attenuator LytR-CpsA-Psr, subfamily M [Paenibacillus pasadenensis]